jgi:signal transduction histidine kinase
VLRIRDRGIGIPAADLPHLYESFHRGANVDNVPGTGLGLAIVKRCVMLHGGTIDVESEVGEGTCFTVRLPYVVEALSDSPGRTGERTLECSNP